MKKRILHKKKYKIHNFRKSIEKFNVGAKSCAEGDKDIEKNYDLQWNKGKGILRTSLHPAKLPTLVKRKDKEFYSTIKQ